MESNEHPRFDELQALRLRLHRLDPPRPLRDARRAAAFVRERRIVMSAGHSSLPVLTEAIAGRHLTGSWMAHPEVERIYNILRKLKKHGVLTVPLILGKGVWIDPLLGPAVARIASDPDRCGRARDQLPQLARRLLDEVEANGRVRMDRWSVPTTRARRARVLLERELLVTSSDLHTERGYHTSIVMPWRASNLSARFSKAAARLTFDEAQDQLLLAAVRSAVIAPEREARRWCVFGAERVDIFPAQGKLRRLIANGRTWLTCRQ